MWYRRVTIGQHNADAAERLNPWVHKTLTLAPSSTLTVAPPAMLDVDAIYNSIYTHERYAFVFSYTTNVTVVAGTTRTRLALIPE